MTKLMMNMTEQHNVHGRLETRWLAKAGYAVLAVMVGVIVTFNIWRPIVVLPRISLAPGYAFSGPDGATVSSEQARGLITLYSFSYGSCAVPTCQQSLTQIGAFQTDLFARLPTEARALMRFVTISLDPNRDQAPRWAMVASQYPMVTLAWWPVVGDEARTRQVVGNGFGLYYRERAGQITFEPRYVLVDAARMIRAYYLSNDPDVTQLLRDVALLRKEMAEASGAWRLAYEAAHLFACYPK
jgi:protein SCO1/2